MNDDQRFPSAGTFSPAARFPQPASCLPEEPSPQPGLRWPNSTSRTPGSVLPTFEDATIVVAAIATAAASMIVVPGGRGLAGAGLACLMIAIAAVDARRFIIPDELTAAALALGLADAALRHPDGIGAALALAALRGAIVAAAFFACGRSTGAKVQPQSRKPPLKTLKNLTILASF